MPPIHHSALSRQFPAMHSEPQRETPLPQRAAILLAAGGSTRLGRPKQMVQIGGKSLLRRAAESALDSGVSPVIVVLGNDAEKLISELGGLSVRAVVNPAWRQGMGGSLCCGVETLQQEAPLAAAVLLMVCDQPFITAAHLQGLWARHAASGKVIAVSHDGHPGVPAIFPSKYLPRLIQITGDQGARSLLRGLSTSEMELVEMPEAAFDLDTPENLAQFTQKAQRMA